ncbi:MAG: hypothetical protein ACR2O6_03350 [Ilumatobacteraceae bacterium]
MISWYRWLATGGRGSTGQLVGRRVVLGDGGAHGAEEQAWYRSLGTAETPGPTIVTITGDVQRSAVAQISPGRPLNELIDALAGGPRPGRTIKAVLSGVANPVITGDHLAAGISYEGSAAVGAGLGSAGFIVYDNSQHDPRRADLAHHLTSPRQAISAPSKRPRPSAR